jgi:hypothetical protein
LINNPSENESQKRFDKNNHEKLGNELEQLRSETQSARENLIEIISANRVSAYIEKLENGGKLFFYESALINVDAEIESDYQRVFSISSLKLLGLDGWDLITAIPKTLGVGLRNTSANGSHQTWGGGIGGNIIGAHLILKKEITQETKNYKELISNYTREIAIEEVSNMGY